MGNYVLDTQYLNILTYLQVREILNKRCTLKVGTDSMRLKDGDNRKCSNGGNADFFMQTPP